MDEGVRQGIDKIRKVSDSLHRRAKIYSELGKIDDRGTARALGSLQRASAPGKKITKIGFIFLLSPDPFTTPIGIPMIIAGKYLDRVYNGATIKDVGQETKNFFSDYSNLKDNMH
ncbi:MAG TPA: hypothetical protein VJ571_04720 [Candidatus Nitrosotalea sp.]|nr:hypothetical protein [Candidatus Nitrosotalea sp.]